MLTVKKEEERKENVFLLPREGVFEEPSNVWGLSPECCDSAKCLGPSGKLRHKARPCGLGPESGGKERTAIWSGPRYPALTPGVPDSEFMAKQLFSDPSC